MTNRARLGDVSFTTSGGTPLRSKLDYFGGDIPWVKSGDLCDGLIPVTDEFLTEAGLAGSSAKLLPSGTLLMAMYGATVGKLGILGFPAATNQAVCAIVPQDELDRDYLFHFLLAKREELIASSRGGAQPNISQTIIRDLEVPLPPLDEQRRIVDLLNRASGIRRLAEAAQAKARALIPALFAEMFGDPATNPKGWPIVGLSDAAAIRSGVTKGRKVSATVRPVPYMRVANIQDGVLAMSEVKEIEITEDELRRFRLEAGDLLMTEGGDIDKLGRTAIWTGEIDPCIHQNHVFCVRLDRSRALPDYVATLAGSGYGKAYFLKVAKRTTGIASINKTQLSQFPLLLPPLDLQREFETRVAEAKSQIAFAERAGRTAEALTQSIMAKVFLV